MSAHIRLLPFVLLVCFANAAFSASDPNKASAGSDSAARADKAVAKSDASSRSVAGSSNRPAETRPASEGSVTQALTRLYRVPRSGQSRQFGQASHSATYSSGKNESQALPRQFGAPGHGEAPRQIITDNSRMGYQHVDAIRNSVSEQPIDDDLRQPPSDGSVVENKPGGPAVPLEDSMTAQNWGPNTDQQYEREQPAADRDSNFGFTQQSYRRGDWARRANDRTQSAITTAGGYFKQGLAAFREGNYRLAVKCFKFASDTNRGDPAAMIYSAHALFAVGRYQESAAFLRKAFALEPRISMLTYDMRDDYTNKADFAEQVRALNNAIAASPSDIDRLTLLGYVLNYSNQPDRAFEVLSRARAVAPRDTLAALLYESTHPPDAMNAPPRTR